MYLGFIKYLRHSFHLTRAWRISNIESQCYNKKARLSGQIQNNLITESLGRKPSITDATIHVLGPRWHMFSDTDQIMVRNCFDTFPFWTEKRIKRKKRCGRSYKYNLGLVGRPSLGWNTRWNLFINGWDLSHMSRWERAVWKHLKYFKGNLMNVVSVAFNMSPSDFSIISEGNMQECNTSYWCKGRHFRDMASRAAAFHPTLAACRSQE